MSSVDEPTQAPADVGPETGPDPEAASLSANSPFVMENPATASSADGGAGGAGETDGDEGDPAEDLLDELDGSTEAAMDADSDAAAAQVELDLDLATLAKERDDYLGALQRLQADFENYKKRMQRQQIESFDRAGEDLAVKLLPVLDTIDLARQHGEGDAVAPLATALLDALTKEGLERIDPVGEAFDPNEHEAVSHEAGNGDGSDQPVVSGLMRAGYRWKGRLVRPAMVTVRG